MAMNLYIKHFLVLPFDHRYIYATLASFFCHSVLQWPGNLALILNIRQRRARTKVNFNIFSIFEFFHNNFFLCIFYVLRQQRLKLPTICHMFRHPHWLCKSLIVVSIGNLILIVTVVVTGIDRDWDQLWRQITIYMRYYLFYIFSTPTATKVSHH